MTATVDAYFAMWNEEEGGARLQHAKEAWAENGRYVDPAREGEGHQGLSEMMAVARTFSGLHAATGERGRRSPRQGALRLGGGRSGRQRAADGR